jgi:hypothetical protein
MTFLRALPWKGRIVFLHPDDTPTPYWIASVDGVDVFTAVQYAGADNVDEVTAMVKQWIDEGSLAGRMWER